MKWRPIKTAPKDKKTRVLVYDPKLPIDEQVHIDSWDYLGRDKNDDSVYGWDGKPTHWMPLPKPPRAI